MSAQASMDAVFERAFEHILERNIEKLAKANRPRMMSFRRACVYLDVSRPQLMSLMAEWGIKSVQYRQGGNCYVEREEIDRMIERLKGHEERKDR